MTRPIRTFGRLFLSMVLLGALAGCQASGQSAKQAEVLPAIEVDYGPGILHRYSNSLFPREVAGFELVDHRIYDPDGRDFSAIYQKQESAGRTAVIAHVFPTGVKSGGTVSSAKMRELVETEIGRAQAQLRRSHREAKLVDTGQLVLPLAGSERTVLRAIYKHQDTPLIISQIYVSLLNESWYLKYRITSWGFEPGETYGRIGPLMAQIPRHQAGRPTGN